ncbi:cilia- and flagella-associated protein 47 [Holotrichia oblita]|uniref:Cilia- and flagella-associated protein 47 n=1 Tax=Holotrichia oblita TaxID=644536 RepID=A0ACB9TC11_HOLOL|nr:cilia- and flagella-associated protein 47 [Holotrichia oblita]
MGNYPKDIQEAKLPCGVVMAAYVKHEQAEKDDGFVAFNEKFRIDSCKICARCNENIIFPFGDTKDIKENSQFELEATYYAQSVGYCTANFDVIVNECIVFVVTVLAEVCTCHLRLNKKCIEFTEQNTQAFFEIANPINADIMYNFVIPTYSFQIDPIEGVVKPFKTQMCHVRYVPNTDCPSDTEAEFYSNERFSQYLRLTMKSEYMKPSFIPEEVVFENIPLNLPVQKNFMIVNRNGLLMAFKVVSSEFSKYMKVYPSEGVIPAKSTATLTITVTLPCCVIFSTVLKLFTCKCKSNSLVVKGNVVYPNITMSPKMLQFTKIPASSTSVLPFSLTNKTEAPATIQFDMTSFNDLNVYRSECRWESPPVTEVVELSPHDTLNFFLHFAPLDTTCDSCILPVIINGMLGPVVDELITNQVSYFITEIVPDSYFVVIPERLPRIKVKTYATAPKISIHKADISLKYSHVQNWSKTNYDLRISNHQHNTEEFCIRTERVGDPLKIEYSRGKKVACHMGSFICSLSQHEEVVFTISFHPIHPGLYKTYMPLILKSDGGMRSHNFFTITADFQPPIIKCDSQMIYLHPLPLNSKLVCSKQFTLLHHAPECIVQCSNSASGVTTEIADPAQNYETRDVTVIWQLEAASENIISINAKISCTCLYTISSKSQTKKHSSANMSQDTLPISLTSKESSLKSQLDDIDELYEDYPLFPSPDEKVSKFMQGCVDAVEEWMHSQVFFGSIFYTVPNSINLVKFNPKTRKKDEEIIPYIQLLENLAGKKFTNNIVASENDEVIFCYKTYKQAIRFLSAAGAYFPHVRPELLLEYSSYCLYVKNCYENGQEQLLNPTDFYRISKQCWLDLLLQTYKIFVLNTLCNRVEESQSKCPLHEIFRNLPRTTGTTSNLFSDNELMLLNWLNFNYEEIRQRYWSDNPALQARNIIYFNHNMEDGFVFAAVTLAYCPYLEEHFKKLYPKPVSYEDALHNNITVLEAWKLLNLTIQISPQTLMQSHSVVNLMLTAYLFEILPEMYPCELMKFHSGLSQTHSSRLTITNQNDFPVCYKPIFIGPSETNFGTDCDFYVIPANNKCVVLVSYTAKFIRSDQCALILSGECAGYHYAKSKVVNLHGMLNVKHVITTITFTSELYTSKKRSFDLKSPYNTNRETSYTIQFTPKSCDTIEDLNSMPFQSEVSNLTLYRLFPLTAELVCNEDGVGVLNTLCSTWFTKEVCTVIYFSNSSVGCFGVAIVSKVKPSSPYRELIDIAIPTINRRSSSKRSYKVVYMKIPAKNKLMWSTVIEAMSNNDKETELFRKLSSKYCLNYSQLHVHLCTGWPTKYVTRPYLRNV